MTPAAIIAWMTLADVAVDYALSLGFDSAATLPLPAPRTGDAFRAWIEAGYHGEMAYLAERAPLRLAPAMLAPGAQSMIVMVANYARPGLPIARPDGTYGRIARYAWPADYHDILKAQLFKLDAFLRRQTGRDSLGKACVDSAPLLERDFAEQAGLGFTGRNTCLITPGLGSWTFIAALLVPEQLEARLSPRAGHLRSARHVFEASLGSGRPSYTGCGSCTRCLDACPTKAFVADHVLDARRCISYLTIELRGPIPRDLRPLVGRLGVRLRRMPGCLPVQPGCAGGHDARAPGGGPRHGCAGSDPAGRAAGAGRSGVSIGLQGHGGPARQSAAGWCATRASRRAIRAMQH